MARHAAPKAPTARRVLALLATAHMALGAAATTAAAADSASSPGATGSRTGALGGLGGIGPRSGLQTATDTAGQVTGPVTDVRPNPFTGSRVDPLDNGVGTRVADFKPVNTRAVTGPVAEADSIGGIRPVGRTARAAGV